MLTHVPYFTKKAFGWRTYVLIHMHDDEEHSKCDIYKKKQNKKQTAKVTRLVSCHVMRLVGGSDFDWLQWLTPTSFVAEVVNTHCIMMKIDVAITSVCQRIWGSSPCAIFFLFRRNKYSHWSRTVQYAKQRHLILMSEKTGLSPMHDTNKWMCRINGVAVTM